jgi:putative flippase GtrA
MAPPSPFESAPPRYVARARRLGLKAISFALIGVVNTAVDYGVFLLARALLSSSAIGVSVFGAVGNFCHCASAATATLIAANIISWTVAVSGSYIMNSSITFAAESGRKLNRRAYASFVASGIIGLIANTAALLFAAEALLLPVWLAKGVAILASFVVNFSFSHFVVFRAARQPTDGPGARI